MDGDNRVYDYTRTTHGGGHVDGAAQGLLFADTGERAGRQYNVAGVFHLLLGDVAHSGRWRCRGGQAAAAAARR